MDTNIQQRLFLGAVTPCIKELKIIIGEKASADGSWNWTENNLMINVAIHQSQKFSLSYECIFVLIHEMTHAFSTAFHMMRHILPTWTVY